MVHVWGWPEFDSVMRIYKKRGPFQTKTGKRKEENCWCSPMQHVFNAHCVRWSWQCQAWFAEVLGCGNASSLWSRFHLFFQYLLLGWNLNLSRWRRLQSIATATPCWSGRTESVSWRVGFDSKLAWSILEQQTCFSLGEIGAWLEISCCW